MITGALTGIGRATALAFARNGASVVISGIADNAGSAFAHELRALGSRAYYIHADVRDETDVTQLVDETVARLGRIDVAVNNAGIGGQLGLVEEQTISNFRETFETNVLGTLLSLKHELRLMRVQGHGNIINVSSTLGHRSAPGTSVYCASKHAIEGLTKAAALEAASFGVRVNAVAPGPVQTEMFEHFADTIEKKSAMIAAVPLNRPATAEEIAQSIVFLASDKATFITGHILSIDGGKCAA